MNPTDPESQTYRRDWDRRALQDARGFTASHDHETEEKFVQSGERDGEVLFEFSRLAGDCRHDRVLEIGCGIGRLLQYMIRHFDVVTGVDVSPEMLRKARGNVGKRKNVEFRLGEIEHLPVADNSVDVIMSNCVINLSPDKPAVFREAFRVLKAGGRLVVSDIVLERALPPRLKTDAGLYAACISGALLRSAYLSAVRDAGFQKLEILSDRVYKASSVGEDPITGETGAALAGVAASITLLARKTR